MKKNILLTVAYDGTDYFGFQRQNEPNLPTVQGALEKGLSTFFKQDIVSDLASRTDKGVHALGQRVLVKVDTTVPVENLPMALPSFLPDDIVIRGAEEVADDFHPRYNCIKKEYCYKIYDDRYKNPLYRNVSEFSRNKLDILKMQEGAKYLVGTHDFKSFQATGSNVKTTVRTIFDMDVKRDGDFILITVVGSGFLYNMVRIIAGTLIAIGEGKILPEDVEKIMKSCDRTKAGKTAVAGGLTLVKIDY